MRYPLLSLYLFSLLFFIPVGRQDVYVIWTSVAYRVHDNDSFVVVIVIVVVLEVPLEACQDPLESRTLDYRNLNRPTTMVQYRTPKKLRTLVCVYSFATWPTFFHTRKFYPAAPSYSFARHESPKTHDDANTAHTVSFPARSCREHPRFLPRRGAGPPWRAAPLRLPKVNLWDPRTLRTRDVQRRGKGKRH